MMGPTRPALRYHGGKWKLAPWIISHFPEHTCYVEAFGGGASVLLRKPPSFTEVYNDLNCDVVNFFRVLRERPADLISAIDLTPYSRSEFAVAQEETLDPLEKARRFFVWSWQGRGRAGVKEPGGWRFMVRATRGKTPVDDFNNIDHLWAVVRRLKQVQFENNDALGVIRRFDAPTTLFYVDPPYVQDTRSNRWKSHAYSKEYTNDQHNKLAGLLNSITGMVILSGYPSEMYNDFYPGWKCSTKISLKDNAGGSATECLWLNQAAANKHQLDLFQPGES
jgi:DNA adenine methylase